MTGHITIPIELEFSDRSRILLESLSKVLPPRVVEQAAAAPTASPSTLRIGERSEAAGGIYAGVAVGENGEPDAHLFLLDAKPDGKLAWADAVAWAEKLGNGARLPTRFESALLYANLQSHVKSDEWHWTGTQYSDSHAWGQDFSYGYQYYYYKSYEARCRAVRRLPL